MWGLLASMPFGGMIWQVFHHLEGFRRLGFDVWYVEDSLNPCMHPETWERVGYYDDTLRFLDQTMTAFGFQGRWVFRPPGLDDVCLGSCDARGLADLYKEAKAVFNLCGANRVRPELQSIGNIVMLQTDPVAPQVMNAKGNQRSIEYHARHRHHFTYAENIGKRGCTIPEDDFAWIPTRPPIITDWWATNGPPPEPRRLTTIANWDTRGKDVEWNGETLRWSKAMEFERLIKLPERAALGLELSVSRMSDEDRLRMEDHGWTIGDARTVSTADRYRDYVRGSMGEFTATKEQVVKTRSGWFSDRSACYLAAGRPVITQDTGFGDVLPTGTGLLSFSNFEEADAAIADVADRYEEHATQALALAREYFEAEKVLGEVLRHTGLL